MINILIGGNLSCTKGFQISNKLVHLETIQNNTNHLKG